MVAVRLQPGFSPRAPPPHRATRRVATREIIPEHAFVLAGDLGTAGLEGLDFRATHNHVATQVLPIEKAPVFIGAAKDVIAKIKPVDGQDLVFRTSGLAMPDDAPLAPFYRVHRQRYAIYRRLMERFAYKAERHHSAATSATK